MGPDSRSDLLHAIIERHVGPTTLQLSMQDGCPLLPSVWPSYWSGQLALNHESMLIPAKSSSSVVRNVFGLGQRLWLCGVREPDPT